jgi:cellobiose phosphorylase
VRHGEAKNSWLTGTAAWNFVAITQFMLGVRPGYDGLTVKPCIDHALLPTFTVRRRCRGVNFEISVKNTGTGPVRLRVDGRPIDGTVVPYGPAGSTVRVECEC